MCLLFIVTCVSPADVEQHQQSDYNEHNSEFSFIWWHICDLYYAQTGPTLADQFKITISNFSDESGWTSRHTSLRYHYRKRKKEIWFRFDSKIQTLPPHKEYTADADCSLHLRAWNTTANYLAPVCLLTNAVTGKTVPEATLVFSCPFVELMLVADSDWSDSYRITPQATRGS